MIRNTMCNIFFMFSTRLEILSMTMIDNIHVRLELSMLLLFNLLQLSNSLQLFILSRLLNLLLLLNLLSQNSYYWKLNRLEKDAKNAMNVTEIVLEIDFEKLELES